MDETSTPEPIDATRDLRAAIEAVENHRLILFRAIAAAANLLDQAAEFRRTGKKRAERECIDLTRKHMREIADAGCPPILDALADMEFN